jgi:leucyl aminopeptidase
VLAVARAAAELALPVRLRVYVPLAENMPDGRAYRPGDIVRCHNGKTVEIVNTDAEGRLILADALAWAAAEAPDSLLELSTLTGAAVVALGQHAAAIMTSEDGGAAERLAAMEAAGTRAGERVHPLPMFAAYAKDLESDVADLKNVGGRAAGAVTAAKFLEHFVAYPWIHVDIAGPSFLKKALPYRPVGGTGFGVRLLVEYLRSYADRKRG